MRKIAANGGVCNLSIKCVNYRFYISKSGEMTLKKKSTDLEFVKGKSRKQKDKKKGANSTTYSLVIKWEN